MNDKFFFLKAPDMVDQSPTKFLKMKVWRRCDASLFLSTYKRTDIGCGDAYSWFSEFIFQSLTSSFLKSSSTISSIDLFLGFFSLQMFKDIELTQPLSPSLYLCIDFSYNELRITKKKQENISIILIATEYWIHCNYPSTWQALYDNKM